MVTAVAVGYERIAHGCSGYVERLVRAAHDRQSNPYTAIDWDKLSGDLDTFDWDLPTSDPLRQSAWYLGLSAEERRRAAAARIAQMFRTAVGFELQLVRSLTVLAERLPRTDPSYAFVMQEMVDELHHIQMFEEVVVRMPVEVPDESREEYSAAAPMLERFIDDAPDVYMLVVLGGEVPIDHAQRALAASPSAHPLVRSVCKLHVAEEARHIAFARRWLRDAAEPSDGRRTAMDKFAPFVLRRIEAAASLPDWYCATFGVPDDLRLHARPRLSVAELTGQAGVGRER